MGRIKSLQPDPNLFSVRYHKLVEENNTNNTNSPSAGNNTQLVQNIIRMQLSQDYIAYSCGQCGHHQKFDIQVLYLEQ